jgi:hypothetical protein
MSNLSCLNCGASEQDRPLLTIQFQGKEFHICPQCLPVLIHKPHELVEKLPGFQPADYPIGQDD